MILTNIAYLTEYNSCYVSHHSKSRFRLTISDVLEAHDQCLMYIHTKNFNHFSQIIGVEFFYIITLAGTVEVF
jgi:hypothetical protein